jgi:hypothetical protein
MRRTSTAKRSTGRSMSRPSTSSRSNWRPHEGVPTHALEVVAGRTRMSVDYAGGDRQAGQA